jgi:beta-lactam-binding protein with PASTA domain
VVAAGGKDSSFAVPQLIGKTYEEAKYMLDSMGVMAVPVPNPDVLDTSSGIIWKQDPRPPATIRSGTVVDLWLETGSGGTDTTK